MVGAAVGGVFGRTSTHGGRAVLTTKSVNSYTEIDELFAACGLMPRRQRDPACIKPFAPAMLRLPLDEQDHPSRTNGRSWTVGRSR